MIDALLCVVLGAGQLAGAQDPLPDRGTTEPLPPRDPRDPPDPLPEPEPDPEPEPLPEPDPEPDPEPTPTPTPLPDDGSTPRAPGRDRLRGAPNVDIDVTGRSSTVSLGGDLIIAPKCKGDSFGCNGGRIGFQARFPVTQESPTGTSRASVDALGGFVSSWRVGLIGEYLRDATGMDGPAKVYMVGLDVDWGVQTFRYFPEADARQVKTTRHSIKGMFRFLAYIHQPRRYRIAPQFIARYDRNWAGANPVGIVVPAADDGAPDTTVDSVVAGPQTRPVMTFTLPVPFTIQRGKKVLPQLGFGPTVRYAVAGTPGGYNPFGGGHTVRGELWLYWFPTGQEGLDVQKTNVRIGVAPYMDAFVAGRAAGQPTTNFGALVEVRVGVRGYEY
jgi:hypothetical protein